MIRLLNDLRSETKLKIYFFKQLALFLKYLCLIIYCNDWIIIENKGLFGVFGKLMLTNLYKKLKLNFLSFSSGITIIIITVFSIGFFSYVYFKLKIWEYEIYEKTKLKKIMNRILSFFQFFYFLIFNYTLEILLSFSFNFNNLCTFDKSNHINLIANDFQNSNSTNNITELFVIKFRQENCKSDFSIDTRRLGFSVTFTLVALILNYYISIVNVSCYSTKDSDFKGEYDSMSQDWLFLYLIQILIIFEVYFQINKLFFYIKVSLRILFMLYFIIKIKQKGYFIDITEFFFQAFCFFSCLCEMIYLKDFLNNFNFELDVDMANFLAIHSDYFNYSIQEEVYFFSFYRNEFIIARLMIVLCLSLMLVILKNKMEYNYVCNYYSNTYNIANILDYYTKLFYYMYNTNAADEGKKNKFYGMFLFNLKQHIEDCKLNGCLCVASKKFILNYFNKKKDSSEKLYDEFMIEFIAINLDWLKNNVKCNHVTSNKIVFIETIFCFYFKNFMITSFFDLEKLLNTKGIYDKIVSNIRLRLFKFDIISIFLHVSKNYKTGKNQYFTYLYSRFVNFLYLEKFKDDSLKSFNLYKKLNHNIHNNIQSYNLMNFKSDLKQLCKHVRIFDEKISLLKKFQRENTSLQNNMDEISDLSKNDSTLIKNINLYVKFFHGKDNILGESNLFKRSQDITNMQEEPGGKNQPNKNRKQTSSNLKQSINNKAVLRTDEEKILEPKLKERIESLIIRQTEDKRLVLDKVTPTFAQDLHYKSSELLGRELEFFLPYEFIDTHAAHVVDFLKKNNLLVKNKEIFFIGKNGYCINYYISGTIILSLNDEVIFYVELQKLSSIIENYYHKIYLCIDLGGEIIAYDKGIKDHMFLDSESIHIIKPNFFKNFLNISNQKFDFEKENLYLDISYVRLLRHINSLDYTKIIDKKDFTKNNFILNKLNDNLKLFTQVNPKLKIPIYLKKRNLYNTYFFYDIRMDFTQIIKCLEINKPKFLTSCGLKNLKFYQFIQLKTKNKLITDSKESKTTLISVKEKTFQNIEYLTFCYFESDIVDNKNLYSLNKILFFFQYLYEEYLSPSNGKINTFIARVISKINSIPYQFKSSTTLKMRFFWNLIFSIFFILFFYCYFTLIDIIKDVFLYKSKSFVQFSNLSIILKGLTMTVTNSFFSILFIKNNLEKESYAYSNIINNNSLAYHLSRIKGKINLAQDYLYKFNLLYNEYFDTVFDKNESDGNNTNYLNLNFKTENINLDWTIRESNFTLIKHLYFQHYLCSEITVNNIINSNYYLYNFTLNDYKTKQINTDKTLFFYQENIISKVDVAFSKTIQSVYNTFLNYLDSKIFVLYLTYITAFLLIESYVILNLLLFTRSFNTLYKKYYSLLNSFKIYYTDNMRKTNLILDIINDFTDQMLINLKKKQIQRKNSNQLKAIKSNQVSLDKSNNTNDRTRPRELPGIMINNNNYSPLQSHRNEDIGKKRNFLEFFMKEENEYTDEEQNNIMNKFHIFYSIFNTKFIDTIYEFKAFLKYSNEDINTNQLIKAKARTIKKQQITNTNKDLPNLKNINTNFDDIGNLSNFKNSRIKLNKKMTTNKKIIDLEKEVMNNNNGKDNNDKLKATAYNINITESSINKTDALFLTNSSIQNNAMKNLNENDNEILEDFKTIKMISNKLKELDQKNIFNLFFFEQDEGNELKSHHEFPSPRLYTKVLAAYYFLILVVAIIGGFLVNFMVSTFYLVKVDYEFLSLFSHKNLYALELLLILKYGFFNFKEVTSEFVINDIISDNLEANYFLFDSTLQDYEVSKKKLKSYYDSYSHLNSLKDLESSFNSKYFCDVYANFTFYKSYNFYPSSNTDEVYSNYKTNCLRNSGGLNEYGLEQSLDSMISLIRNYYTDLKVLIKKNPSIKNSLNSFTNNLSSREKFYDIKNNVEYQNTINSLKSIISNFLNDISYVKVNINLNEYIYESWIYLVQEAYANVILSQNVHENIHLLFDLLIYFIIAILGTFSLLSYYFIIEKPSIIYLQAYDIVKNSINFNIADI